MAAKQLRTLDAIIFKGKEIPKGVVLTIGKDITKEDAAALVGIGKEIEEVLDDAVKAPARQEQLPGPTT